MNIIKRVFLVLLFVISIIGCGKKGAPKPPELLAALPVSNFVASGLLEGINLSWVSPTENASGEVLDDLEKFYLYRAVIRDNEKPDFVLFKEIPIDKSLKEDIDGSVLYQYTDKDVIPGKDYAYYIVSVREGGRKGLESLILRVTFIGQSSVVRVLSPNEVRY